MPLHGRYGQADSFFELKALQQFSWVSSRFGEAGQLVGPRTEQDQAAGLGVQLLQPLASPCLVCPPASTTTGSCTARKPTSAAS